MSSPFAPEDQYHLYLAVRDGNIGQIKDFYGIKEDSSSTVDLNCQPFESLWHEPGPEATALHLAVCCLQLDLVKYLIEHGANPKCQAAGLAPIDVLEKYSLFEPARVKNPEAVEAIRSYLQSS